MTGLMPPRFQAGDLFFDKAFYECYEQMHYPESWLAEGRSYRPEEAYVISHPTWFFEPMPKVPEISIYELFARTAEKKPDETAVVFLDKPASYRQLNEMIGCYAAMLKDLGIGKGDVVSAMLPNSIQHIIAFYGAAMIGAIHSPINVMYQADEVAYQIKDSGAKAVLILDILADRVLPLLKDKIIGNVITTHIKDWAADDAVVSSALKLFWDIPKADVAGAMDFFDSIKQYSPLDGYEPVKAKTDTALLLYTAGTTGKSKGVIETHSASGCWPGVFKNYFQCRFHCFCIKRFRVNGFHHAKAKAQCQKNHRQLPDQLGVKLVFVGSLF
jgi:long-chain acyl-CoA synthetase